MFAPTLFRSSLHSSQMGMDARTTFVGPADRIRPRVAMSPAAIGFWCLLALLAGGCRVDPNIQLMEQELRLQDQRIFDLEEHLHDCHTAVAEHQRENEALRRRLEDGSAEGIDASAGFGAEERASPGPANELAVPQIDEGDDVPGTRQMPPDGASESAPELDPEGTTPRDAPTPARNRPPEPANEGSNGDGSLAPGSESPTARPTGEQLPAPRFSASADAVEQIGLRLAVRYHAAENVPVRVDALVEPQGADRSQVPAAGDISLMIVAADGETEKKIGRWELARWEFAAEDAAVLWSGSPLGTGLQFELPWPGSPRPGEYRLWVRLIGKDGRKHLGSVDFDVNAKRLARHPRPRVPSQSAPPQEGPLLARSNGVDGADHASSEPPPSTPDAAWRPSSEAARLPRRNRVPRASKDTIAEAGPSEGDPFDAWSPDRPIRRVHAVESDAETAARPPRWSPYR